MDNSMNIETDFDETQFGEWLQRATEAIRPSCEEQMALTLSDAMRAEKPSEKVELYAKLANLAMHAVDTTLGAQGCVTTAVTLKLH